MGDNNLSSWKSVLYAYGPSRRPAEFVSRDIGVKITNGDLKIGSKNFHFRGCDIFNNSRYLDLSVDLHLEIPWRFIVALTLIKFCFIYRNFTRSCYFIRFIEILIPQKGNLLLL